MGEVVGWDVLGSIIRVISGLCGDCVNLLWDFLDCRLLCVVGLCVLVMFGVIGDFLCKKFMLVVYDLVNCGLFLLGFGLVGFVCWDWEDEDFVKVVYDVVVEYVCIFFCEEVWE